MDLVIIERASEVAARDVLLQHSFRARTREVFTGPDTVG